METEPDSRPDRCVLAHQVFATLGQVSFRRARSDGTPVMVVPLGEREAAVPLRALQREFAIDDESPDGRMLGLIAESLDFVTDISPGDKLPREVLDGGASWQPDPVHRRRAMAKVRMQLVAWLEPESKSTGTQDALDRLEEDSGLRHKVQRAFEQAATELELADSGAVVALVGELAEELSYIEALRDRLLHPVQVIAARLDRLVGGYRGDHQRVETSTQVGRLIVLALRELGARFNDVDAQTGEVMAAMRNIESQQAFIRSNRDLLYRSLRGWEAVLAEWEALEGGLNEASWALITRTYQFLAPRYMAVTEWPASSATRGTRSKRIGASMTW